MQLIPILVVVSLMLNPGPDVRSLSSAHDSPPNVPAGRVIPGADRLLSGYLHLIEGKRVALVSNHSGRLSNGVHLADTLFRHPGVKLLVLFGMEFDIRSNDYSMARDKEKDLDKATGLVKYSLYGEVHKPTPEMLKDVDVLVFDIQEVGTRFYEHINILGFVMEAAAENNLEVIVLDRPNPLGGTHVDGFVTENDCLHRFGSYAKVPVIHGMTMGELASMYNGENMLRGGVKAKLHVIEMSGWNRTMWFDQTGMEWRKPSPNLLSLSSVLAYTGTCLFEGLNISEGRGTDKPFEYVGAPWIDNKRASELLNGLRLPGVEFEPIEFTPEKKPHLGREPELSGERCKGIYVNVTDRNVVQPYRAGIALVWAYHKLHAAALKWDEKVFERLTATKKFTGMIREGLHPDEIFASWDEDVRAFVGRSKKYLIYK